MLCSFKVRGHHLQVKFLILSSPVIDFQHHNFTAFLFASYRESHTEWLHPLVCFLYISFTLSLYFSLYISVSLCVNLHFLFRPLCHFNLTGLHEGRPLWSPWQRGTLPSHYLASPFPSLPPTSSAHTHTFTHTCSLCFGSCSMPNINATHDAFVWSLSGRRPLWSYCCSLKCTNYTLSHNNDDTWSSEPLENVQP